MVAGCSFSAVSKTLPGTSWSEVLADKLGWELVNLARQGCSNGGIRLQIEEIRKQKPDFAIVSATFWDRMEIPNTAAPYDWTQKSGGWAPPLEKHLQDRTKKNGYNRADGLNNVNYGNNNYNMICETIFTLAENYDHPYRSGLINKQAQTGIRHWIDSIYDSNWKKQMDEWIITEGVMQMFHDGINFLVLPNLLWPFDRTNQDQWRDAFPKVIPNEYILTSSAESPQGICGNNPFSGEDPGYHSSPAGQTLIAENWYRRITEEFDLK